MQEMIQAISLDIVSDDISKPKMALEFIKKCAKQEKGIVNLDDPQLECFSKVIGQNFYCYNNALFSIC